MLAFALDKSISGYQVHTRQTVQMMQSTEDVHAKVVERLMATMTLPTYL
jgi:hypothetical protein